MCALSREAGAFAARHTRTAAAHVRSARSLVVRRPRPAAPARRRIACATAFLSASSGLASLSRKVMNELRRSLGAKAMPAWRLSTALTSTSVQRPRPRAAAGCAAGPPPPAAGPPRPSELDT